MMPLLGLALCLSAVCLSASPEPAPAATAPAVPARRPHSLTVEAVNEGAAALRESFGDDWSVTRPYVDLMLGGPTAYNRRLRALGIRTMTYADVNFCSNASGPFRNPSPFPDCTDWPGAAFYAEPGHPERALTARLGGDILQRLLDPGSTEGRARALAAVGPFATERESDLIQLDDAEPPDEYYAALCWGAFGPGKGCAGAPGGEAAAPWAESYTRPRWLAGMRALIAALPQPVAVNGLAGWDRSESRPAVADLVATTPNAWGAICDGCFYGAGAVPTNRFQWSGPLFLARLAGAMRVTAAGKNVVVVADGVTDETARSRALAGILLFYEADRTWFWGAGCGRRSHIHVCPEAALTFSAPPRGTPARVADVEAPGGALVREFKACYLAGKPAGPCATVVNPDPYVAKPLPEPERRFRHTLRIEGDSLCACYGEKGSVSLEGPAAPDPLPAASGYVLFR